MQEGCISREHPKQCVHILYVEKQSQIPDILEIPAKRYAYGHPNLSFQQVS